MPTDDKGELLDEANWCEDELVVTLDDLAAGVKRLDADGEPVDPEVFDPFFKKVYVGPGEVCKTTIRADKDLGKNIGFGASEWQDDLFVTMTKLEKDDDFDGETS